MANPEHLAQLNKGVDSWNVWREQNPNINPDLSDGILSGAHLFRANLSGAHLFRANLSGANLSEADFSRANLFRANLEKANLTKAILKDIKCSGANFSGANLSDANLRTADLTNTNLSEVNLSEADLFEANLFRANLEKANLTKAILILVRFLLSNLTDANLTAAVLNGANLIDATLMNANLTDARLWEIQKDGWNIKGVKCKQAYWDREGTVLSEYEEGAFERAYAEKPQIELEFKGGIDPVEMAMLPLMVQKLAEENSGIQLHIRSMQDDGNAAKVRITVDDTQNRSPEEFQKEFEKIKENLEGKTKLLKEHIDTIQSKNLLIDQLKERLFLLQNPGLKETEILTIFFMDLTKFSQMNEEKQQKAMRFVRNSANALFGDYLDGSPLRQYANTWGDAIFAVFDDPNSGVCFALELQEMLEVKKYKARMGMSFGKLNIEPNAVTSSMAPEGVKLSEAARLEPMAEPGEVLISDTLRAHPDLDESKFNFEKTERSATKDFADVKKGNPITCYIATINNSD